MKTNLLSLAALAIILTISSCSKDSSSSSGCTNTFPYLADGHKLVYKIKPSQFYPDTLYTSVFAATSTQGVFLEKDTSNAGYATGTSYLKPCNGKLYYATSLGSASAFTNYYYDQNSSAGFLWVKTGSTGYGNDTSRILAKNVSVIVPAGTFTCDEILVGYDTSYFSSTVGEVKHSSVNISYDLISKNF